MHGDSKIPLNCLPQERPSLCKGNLVITEGVALYKGNYYDIFSGAPDGWAVPAPLVASVIFFLPFSFETVYKKAEDMQVPEALSMCENVKADIVESPVEDNPYFLYLADKVG